MKNKRYSRPSIKVADMKIQESIMVNSFRGDIGIGYGGNASEIPDISADVNKNVGWEEQLW